MRVRTVALAAGGLAAGVVAERLTVGRSRARADPAEIDAFRLPADATHRRLATSDGGEMHVVERGAGRPLVLLHGITLSALAWHYQLLDLSDRFRVLAVDHRGHGSSSAGSAAWDIGRLALDVCELFEALDLTEAVVVGHSMGGMVALQLAVDHPDVFARRVAGLVLLSTSAGPLHRLAGRVLVDAIAPLGRLGLAVADLVPGGLFGAHDLSYLIFRLGLGAEATAAQVEISRLVAAATPVAVLGELLASVAGFDLRRRLGSVTVPAMVMVGTHDVLMPPAAARELVAALPGAGPLVELAGAGHMLMLERRSEVAAAITGFCASGLAPQVPLHRQPMAGNAHRAGSA